MEMGNQTSTVPFMNIYTNLEYEREICDIFYKGNILKTTKKQSKSLSIKRKNVALPSNEGRAEGGRMGAQGGGDCTYFKILIKSSSTSIDMDDNGAAVQLAKGF